MTFFSEFDTKSTESPIPYAIGLIMCAFLSSSLTNPYLMFTSQKGLQIRVALSSMIYKKVVILLFLAFHLKRIVKKISKFALKI